MTTSTAQLAAPLHEWFDLHVSGDGFAPRASEVTRLLQDCIAEREAAAEAAGRSAEEMFPIDHFAIRRRAVALAELAYAFWLGDEAAEHQLGEHEQVIGRIGLPASSIENPRRWFYRTLLRDERRLADYRERLLDRIGKGGAKIVANSVLQSRRFQREQQQAYIDGTEVAAKLDDGTVVSVPFGEICNTPEKRFAKFYVRSKGLGEYCANRGMGGYFVTFTLPPPFHPNPAVGANSWDGSSPLEGHDELQRRWSSFRKRFGKVWGYRVEEQHQDGCVHWHLMIFIDPARYTEFEAKIWKYIGPPPASDIKPHDPTRANSATYFAKYLMKNAATSHLSGEDAITAQRADAHRATWGGRSTQFFDVEASGTVWDEVRRIKDPSAELDALPPAGHELREAAWDNDYERFLTALAPLYAERRLSLVYGHRGSGSKYLRGFEVDGVCIDTHGTTWSLRKARKGSEAA